MEKKVEKKELASKSARILSDLREKRPLVHNITNYVVMNYTANALLAIGAAPVMAHAIDEVEEMVSLAGALVINIGTLSPPWIEAMLRAGRRANELGVPVILDPVGSGATMLRTGTALRLIEELEMKVVRGNASEVLSLGSGDSTTKGVDSIHGVTEASETAWYLADSLGMTLAITGEEDLITDGRRSIKVANGHPLMGTVTGTGCTATVVMGAFLAVEEDPVIASTAALAYWGLAGEKAAESANAPGSYQIALLDSLYSLTPEELEKGARFV
jgi:hydroxyethylthiazole kinase